MGEPSGINNNNNFSGNFWVQGFNLANFQLNPFINNNIFNSFLGKTLWDMNCNSFMNNVGWNGFANTRSIWANTTSFNSPWGDNYTPSFNINKSKTPEKEDLTDEEKKILNRNFDKISKLLKEVAESDNKIITYDGKLDLLEFVKKHSSKTKANYDELIKEYNKIKDKLKNNLQNLPSIKEALVEMGYEYKNKTEADFTLGNWVQDKFNFDDIIEEGELKDGLEILDILSTWNSNGNKKTFIHTIIDKYKELKPEEKESFNTNIQVLKRSLNKEAWDFLKDTGLEEAEKKIVQDALIELRNCEKYDEEFANEFDKLYVALRKAKAKEFSKKLENDYGFLEEVKTFAKGIVTNTNEDLKKEGLID